MIRVHVKNQSGAIGWGGTFETEAEADAWLAQESANGSFGKPEQIIEQEDGSTVVIPAEFTVEKLDLGIEPILTEIREKRNQLLTACDWTQLPDSPLSAEKREQWAAYRQQLRDLPSTADEAGNVVWPEKP